MSASTRMGAAAALILPLLMPSAAHADIPVGQGISVFATIDVGIAYQSAGVPRNNRSGFLEYQAFTTSRNFTGSHITLAENALEQSKIGASLSERLGNSGFSAIGRIETAFNPLSARLIDACGSIADNSGAGSPAAPRGQTANFDSNRCGQAINGVALGGIASKRFGTLTGGRQLSLIQEALATYDPQAAAPAFSFFGYSSFEGGAGSTEAGRLDNSIKYALSGDHLQVAGLYSQGGKHGGVLGKAYMIQLGGKLAGLQVDALYMRANSVVNLRSSFNNRPAPLNGTPPAGLAAFVSKNTSYNIMGRYTLAMAHKAELMVYAGYSHIKKAHADYNGGASQGNYPISVDINVNSPIRYQVMWVGARYTTESSLSISAGFYHITQNDWTIGLGTSGTDNIGCATAGLLCAGHFDEASLLLDMPVVRHIDAYMGVNHSIVTKGLANGFAGALGPGTTGSQSQTTLVTGLHVKF